jgi:citrate lyase subunit beta/citryl-CoA lyase
MPDFAEAGRRGKDVRSDCWVRIEPGAGGIKLTLNSKVEAMFGKAIRKLIRDELAFFDIKDARVFVEDSGALPFVMMARIEAAVKRLNPKEKREYLPELLEHAQQPTSRERFRRSRLYLPGNEPKFMLNAGIHKPDAVILDLEDSVAPATKDEALIMVRNALRQIDFMGAERMVRINQLPRGLGELDSLVAANVHMILIPKCEDPQMVKDVDARIKKAMTTDECRMTSQEPPSRNRNSSFRTRHSPDRQVWLMPIVESCLGVFNALKIASASKNVAALTIGLEDYTADLGTQRTLEAKESFWARSQVVNAARAAGVQPIDTVFSDINDMEGLRQSVLEAKGMGYEGKGCIHPRQIETIHEAFAPAEAEIERAKKIVLAYRVAEASGLGAVALGSKMIDPPVVKRALRSVDMAVRMDKLAPDWDVITKEGAK